MLSGPFGGSVFCSVSGGFRNTRKMRPMCLG